MGHGGVVWEGFDGGNGGETHGCGGAWVSGCVCWWFCRDGDGGGGGVVVLAVSDGGF